MSSGRLSAHDVAAEIRRRLPNVGTKKLHKLLYYGQAHHVAAFGEPLFSESVSAWDMGPVVGSLWYTEKTGQIPTDTTRLGQAELNTVGYVLSRYGRLSGRDLEVLSHGEQPWREADARRKAEGASTARISQVAMASYFAGDADDPDLVGQLDRPQLEALLAGVGDRSAANSNQNDDLGGLAARIDAWRQPA